MSDKILVHGKDDSVLAQKVAELAGLPITELEITSFADTEQRVRVSEDVGDKTVFVLFSVCPPVDEHLMELCLIADALRGMDAKRIVAVLPYLGYMRQDKSHREGEAISARIVARMVEAAGFDKVITIDMHSDASAGFFNIPVNHVFAFPVFAEALSHEKREPVIVAPDAGAAKRAQRFASMLSAPMILLEKTRSLEKKHVVEHMRLIGSAGGREAVIIDDLTTSGGTLAKAADIVKEEGAPRVVACVTHGVFIPGAIETLEKSALDTIFVTDSIPLKKEYESSKIKVVSIAPLLAEAIQKTR